jgi:predicted lipid-binding transport protein (Tim44 family)
MHEPAAAPPAAKFARALGVVDALSAAIAGFALFAGTRAFAFLAIVALREPVLGGAGLMLLALIGWVRWFCRHVVVERTAIRRAAAQGGSSRDEQSSSAAPAAVEQDHEDYEDYAAASDSSSLAWPVAAERSG